MSERAVAEDLLGVDHPLVHVLGGEETARAQLVSVTAVQIAGAVWLLGRWSFGLSLALAAAVVQIALGSRLGLLRSAKREVCLEAIVAGEATPLPCIERTRHQLVERGSLNRLAATIDDMLAMAAGPRAPVSVSCPLASPRVVRAAAPELRQVATLLRADPAVRGVALVEWILSSPATPLYGNDIEPLEQELRRAIYLLTLTVTSDVGLDGAPRQVEPAPVLSSRVERKRAVSNRDDDIGSRDLRFAYTGMGLVYVAALIATLLS